MDIQAILESTPQRTRIKSHDRFQHLISIDDWLDLWSTVSIDEIKIVRPQYRVLKRVFDFVFSTLVIVLVLSWLTPLLLILIKAESKGPLIFKQLRHGHLGGEFYCYKFRSMRVNTLSDKQMAKKGDPRITKVGRFIRKTNIDELPQFLNVFLGQMSVVGPRPHMVTQMNSFEDLIEYYSLRHYVKPGVTGLAQVMGYRGEIKTINDIRNRIRMDVFYFTKWTFGLDLKIIWLTLKNIVEYKNMGY
ncbi:sugar transferase [Croceivirga thetidis]|uniref:Exopolysaccharide biosynthesis protein n=1 Tax=Croceivirga thetidis TaxID=2721623 RepID=A0ABX1GQ46_9FLAO|nr:sugar transferase [Croceivirga thetidis]NKI32038.1 exopolysaccharide biosynthesis protein [Croceivirga thetidis]